MTVNNHKQGSKTIRMVKQARPVFLNLLQVRLPVTAVMSILHRLAGVLLFAITPLLVYYLQASLVDEQAFYRLSSAPGLLYRLVLAVLLWALLHHLFAGVRYLLLDIDIGIEKPRARASAWFVILVAPVVTVLFMWGCL